MTLNSAMTGENPCSKPPHLSTPFRTRPAQGSERSLRIPLQAMSMPSEALVASFGSACCFQGIAAAVLLSPWYTVLWTQWPTSTPHPSSSLGHLKEVDAMKFNEALNGFPFCSVCRHTNLLTGSLPKHFETASKPFQSMQERMLFWYSTRYGPVKASNRFDWSWASKRKLIVHIHMGKGDSSNLSSVCTAGECSPPMSYPDPGCKTRPQSPANCKAEAFASQIPSTSSTKVLIGRRAGMGTSSVSLYAPLCHHQVQRTSLTV